MRYRLKSDGCLRFMGGCCPIYCQQGKRFYISSHPDIAVRPAPALLVDLLSDQKVNMQLRMRGQAHIRRIVYGSLMELPCLPRRGAPSGRSQGHSFPESISEEQDRRQKDSSPRCTAALLRRLVLDQTKPRLERMARSARPTHTIVLVMSRHSERHLPRIRLHSQCMLDQCQDNDDPFLGFRPDTSVFSFPSCGQCRAW